MKKIFKITLALLIIGIIIFYVSDFLCKVEVKCKNCPKISDDIKTFKSRGFYIGTYDTETKFIELKNYNEKINITKVWAEKSWIKNTDDCLCPKFEKIEGYNIIIEFNSTKKDFIFSLMPITEDKLGKTSFGINENRKEMRFENLPKLLKIAVEEKNPDESFGWKKRIISDTIILKLKKNEL